MKKRLGESVVERISFKVNRHYCWNEMAGSRMADIERILDTTSRYTGTFRPRILDPLENLIKELTKKS